MLFSTFTSMLPGWLLFVVIVGGIIGLSCLGVTVKHWRERRLIIDPDAAFPLHEKDEEANRIAFDYLAVMYAFMLSLLVVSAQQKLHSAEVAVDIEAAAVLSAARDSVGLPWPLRDHVQDELRLYTQLVIKDDWSVIRGGHQDNEEPLAASNELSRLWIDYGAQIPRAPLGDDLIENLNTISVQRAERFDISREAIPDALWLFLAIGTIVLIHLATATHVETLKQHLRVIVFISAPMAIFLWLIAELDNPFGGIMHISATPFVHALQVIRQVSGH